MNNNKLNFDPMTGQPINNQNINTTNVSQQNIPIVQPQETTQSLQATQPINIQPQMNQQTIQGIPTVEQSKQEFIDNTQALAHEKKTIKKSEVDYAFIIILFLIIFASIFFLFPILLKYI